MNTYEYTVLIIRGFSEYVYENAINHAAKDGFELFKIKSLPETFCVNSAMLIFRRKMDEAGKEVQP